MPAAASLLCRKPEVRFSAPANRDSLVHSVRLETRAICDRVETLGPACVTRGKQQDIDATAPLASPATCVKQVSLAMNTHNKPSVTLACVLVTNSCSSRPCLNGGTCANNQRGGYTCTCVQNFQGDRCQNCNVYFHSASIDIYCF